MPYTPTTWVNNSAPALNATNLNKLTDELESQAAAIGLAHALPTWANGVNPSLSNGQVLNEIERVLYEVALDLGLSYTRTVWSDGWTPARNATNLNKMENQAEDNRAELDAVPPPPANVYGGSMPNRIPQSTGATTSVSSLSALQSAFSAATSGSKINITSSINGGGATLNFNRDFSALAPVTITCDPGVVLSNFFQILCQGSYIRFKGLDISGNNRDGIKFDVDAHHVELEKCKVHHTTGAGGIGVGVNVQAGPSGYPHHVQLWDCEIYNNGNIANGNKDHNIYWAYSQTGAENVIANCVFYEPAAYNVHLYPSCSGILVTCCTIDDYQPQAQARGPLIISNEGSSVASNNLIVGSLFTNTATYGIEYFSGSGSGNAAYDCLGFNNPSGDFQTGTGMSYTNCTHADPLYINRGARDYRLQSGSPAISKIQSARYGYVPPLDKNGNPRVTADAGAFRA